MDAQIGERPPAAAPVRDAATSLRRVGAQRTLGRIDIHEDLVAGGPAWSELEALCPATIYQTHRFLLPWLATHGVADGITPMIVVAHTSDGAPAALLPFGVRKHGPVAVARFLGGADSNSNVGMFRPDIEFGADDLASLLRAAAGKTRLKPDAFVLTNQPLTLGGEKNPLDIFPHQPSASFCHHGKLFADPADFFAQRLSKDTAKKLRKKRKRLDGMGALAHIKAQSATDVARILDAFFALKLERLRQKHIHTSFEYPQARSYLERACCPRPDRAPSIDLHALTLDDRIIAIFGGAVHANHLHLMFNAFDFDVEIARSSPGDLLLQSILEEACRLGIASFDLGIGEARYKTMWCDQAEPMFDSILAITPLGKLYSAAEFARRRSKRWIKQSRWAWPVAQVLLRRG